jgi:hypothetical protein
MFDFADSRSRPLATAFDREDGSALISEDRRKIPRQGNARHTAISGKYRGGANVELRTLNVELRTSNFELRTSNFELRTLNFELRGDVRSSTALSMGTADMFRRSLGQEV